MFNLLTGPQLLERVEAVLPEHRERLYPPTETLSMFVAQVLSADGSCQQAVDAAMVKRLIAGLKPGDTDTGNPGDSIRNPWTSEASPQTDEA
jgi:hypothetical protein